MNKTMPFTILLMLILHQIPFSPRGVRINIYASGIRIAVNRIPTIDGGNVFPSPEKAPEVAISTHINSCENPRILR